MSDESLPLVVGRMDCTPAELERRCLILLRDEQEKISPDNALISVLCNCVRLVREAARKELEG